MAEEGSSASFQLTLTIESCLYKIMAKMVYLQNKQFVLKFIEQQFPF